MTGSPFLPVEGRRAPTVNMEHPNFRIWRVVSKTDEDYVKAVKYGEREFTAIDPYYQIRLATAAFGPMGEGFNLEVVDLKIMTMKKVTGTKTVEGYQLYGHFRFWYWINELLWMRNAKTDGTLAVEAREGTRIKCSFELLGDIFSGPNDDGMKKLFTDTLTKALSFLGFNNDVFMGSFQGNKYVGGVDDRAPQKDIDKLKLLLNEAVTLGIISDQQQRQSIGFHDKKKWNELGVAKDIKKLQSAVDKKKGELDAAASAGDGGQPAEDQEERQGDPGPAAP